MNLRQIKRKYWYPISVDIEIRLRKLRRFIDRLYRKIWPYIFASFIIFWFYCAFLKMSYDYSLIKNYSHFEALSSCVYTSWRTDGSPGQDPPKKPIVEVNKTNTK
jgi:hypothetical protein